MDRAWERTKMGGNSHTGFIQISAHSFLGEEDKYPHSEAGKGAFQEAGAE